MSLQAVAEEMLQAAKTSAGVHWQDFRGYLETEFQQAIDAAEDLSLEVLNGIKTPEQAQIEGDSIKTGLLDVKLALTVDAKAAAQDAINSALDVLRTAVNSATKVAIF
jgi:hypothetical protein